MNDEQQQETADTNERIVKYRLVTYWDEIPNQITPNGDPVLVERLASMGEKITLRPLDEERLDSLGALYNEEDHRAIEEGTYHGFDAPLLRQVRSQGHTQQPAPAPGAPQNIEGEGVQIQNMTSDELATYIKENRLNTEQTVALAGDEDPDRISAVLDAENIATNNDPRSGVVRQLEGKLAAATEAQARRDKA